MVGCKVNIQEAIRKENMQGKSEEETGRGMNQGGVERTIRGGGMIYEQGNVGVEETKEEEALKDSGDQEPLKDDGYGPQRHDAVCEHERHADCFCESTLGLWFGRQDKEKTVADLAEIDDEDIESDDGWVGGDAGRVTLCDLG
jgi:hypothetical protein